jgi:glutamate dehydrogenase (NAD(P)+)
VSNDPFVFCDEFGPAKVVHVYHPPTGLKGTVVVDNVAAGPAIGGVRMAPDVSTEECFRLARAMTFKNAAASLPHGGGKAVIYGDPKSLSSAEKEALIRAFARSIQHIVDYIPGPDMGTDERSMAWIKDEIGRSVGLPREIGGIPLDRIGATGFGLAEAAVVAEPYLDFDLRGARVAVQGFGSVGYHAARFLAQKDCILVAAADSTGTVYSTAGIDPEELYKAKHEAGGLKGCGIGEELPRGAIVGVDCDIWIPAARPDVITQKNAGDLKAKLVLEGANIPITAEAEATLHGRGVLCVPDFIANAGGVICASVEYHEGSESQAFGVIGEKVRRNTAEVLERMKTAGVTPRQAARSMAAERVRNAMAYRR